MVAFSDTKNVKLGVAKVTFGGVDLGYTKGGVEVEVSTETHKVQVDQFGNSDINEYVLGRNCVVRAPLAETALDNLVEIMPGATLTETGGVLATGEIDLGSTNPDDGDTVTINGVVFTFRDSPSGDFEVDIGGDVATTLDNLQAKLAASTAPSVIKATYTDDDTSALTVTHKLKSTEGNNFTLAASNGGHTVTAMSGGTDSAKRVDVTQAIGSSLLDNARELVLHPQANADNDLSDDFVIPLANTAGQISFAFKLDEERIFNVEFMAYPNPDTKKLFHIGDKNA